jgi:oligoendopeptidase F
VFDQLPDTVAEFQNWTWDRIEPYYQDLQERPLDADRVGRWLSDWTRLIDLLSEAHARLSVAVTQDTTDKQAEARYHAFLDGIHQAAQAENQRLKQKLLESQLEPQNFALQLRKMQIETELFRSENLPLFARETKLGGEYSRLVGAQTVQWRGTEVTLQRLRAASQSPERAERQNAWELAANRWLCDRRAIDQVWADLLTLRRQLASNAGKADYRAFRWQQLLRIDYSPHDCQKFQHAVEQTVTPAATRLYERYRQRIGVERLRPWDLDNDLTPLHFPAIQPYGDVSELEEKTQAIFRRLDPHLGEYFGILRAEGLLDLPNRKGKAPGAYCTSFTAARRPFIFMNAVGLHTDVRTILHESGHAFHNFARYKLPYAQQRLSGMEFNEVASMAIELLAAPYLSVEQGGFWPAAEARRFQLAHLEQILTFWPYMAVVDAFQHWVYTHPDLACDPALCDAKWLELWWRFIPGVDWSDLNEQAMTGWQRKVHILRAPFYYIEYGLAQMGAVQVWRNSMRRPAKALAQYLQALELGGTANLPTLYATAGAKFAFDSRTLAQAVKLVEEMILKLEQEI